MAHVVNPDYHGHTVTLTDDFRFAISGPAATSATYPFGSYELALGAIDTWRKTAEKQKRAEVSIAVAMLDEAGAPITIRGIHAATGELLGCGDNSDIYPAVAHVSALLQERAKITRRRAEINKAIRHFGVSTRRNSGRVSPETYDAAIKTLTDEIAAKMAAAESAAPPKDAAE